VPYFGEIVSGNMILSTLGNMVEEIWREIPKHFINVKLDKYIIMPDHIHGIIIINENLQNDDVEPLHATVLQQQNKMVQRQPRNNVPFNGHMSSISPKSGSLAIIIRSYKSAVSKHIHKIDAGFEWQQSFYDRIIRTQKQLSFIRKYIIENPQKWLN
jgi:REP element-mobilizing transposase RayT